jgi:hypothetical protein
MKKIKKDMESLKMLNDEIASKLGVTNTSKIKYLLKSNEDNYINNKLYSLNRKLKKTNN